MSSSARPRLTLWIGCAAAAAALAFFPTPPTGRATESPPARGERPAGQDGKPLNLNFETGSIRDWIATGDAFQGQPVKGDTVAPRRADMASRHAGDYWIGGFERTGDKPQGTLSSAPFTVTHPWGSFLVGGGPYETTCVELVRADTQDVLFRASGQEEEDMRRVVVDLSAQRGKQIFIRLVDKHSGHWGHINFDDFLLHESKPVFAQRGPVSSPADTFAHSGLPPADAAQAMSVPDGFQVTLFAGEPDVVQPIAMAIDDRGRVWIAEAYSYPARVPDDEAKDRIVIFEDSDGDGKADKRSVFIDGLNLVSGLELGFGGVWVGAAPYLLYIPDKDGDDVPDDKPEVLLDGWGYQDTHETLNAFIWGPDGWLYGCHGVFTHSRVGKPGTPDDQRVPINAGIWRYHPTTHVFEVFAHGTSNPWGVDFDDYGQCFATACVIPHMYHIVQGGRYERQAGQHFNPHTYDDIKTIADHRHYVGNQWRDVDRARSDDVGGGHAHAGAMIYLGGTWPEKYRNAIFMNNIHGARINMDTLTRQGSGYVASHAPDFIRTNDLWSQIINLRYGPDGNVYMIDWYDKNQCHRNERNVHDRSNGRIFKVSHAGGKPPSNLRQATDPQLATLQLEPNDWHVRHARRILQERAAAGKLDPVVRDSLARMALEHKDETRRLRALWALHVTGPLDDRFIERAMASDSPYVRAWTLQLMLESNRGDGAAPVRVRPAAARALEQAARDDSPIVRLYLASALQRVPLDARAPLVAELLKRNADAADPNLPWMVWYALEPLAADRPDWALGRVQKTKLPGVLPFTARRIASTGSAESVDLLVQVLGESSDAQVQLAVLSGLGEAMKGRRQLDAPARWTEVARKLSDAGNDQVRQLVAKLSVTFGDANAMESMRKTLSSGNAAIDARRDALAALLGARDTRLPAVLHQLLAEPALRRDALRGLAAYDDPKTAEAVLRLYPSLSLEEKRDALNTLAARAGTARALVAAVADKKVPMTDLSADVLRQLRNIQDDELAKQIASVWGSLRDTAEDKLRDIRRVRGMLAAKQASADDLPLGRAVFAKTCQQCHILFGTGAKIGPDLTGSNRADLEYLLSNVLDPSAVMAKEYQPHLIATTDGRVLTGLVLRNDANTLTVATANDTITLPRSDVEEMKLTDKSMMPDDLLKQLSDDEVRALVAYLASPAQVPMLATAENVGSFFNGRDLAGWDGDASLWRVETGAGGAPEIVGSTGRDKGIDRNEFLKSHLLVGDFKFSCEVKLTPNSANSGIQFRSEVIERGDVRGYQADIGAGWWGKLYEEHGRGLLWTKSAESQVRPHEWTRYEIVAQGSRIKTYLNGELSVDLDDPTGARRGIIALQIHSGGPTEVRFKNLKLSLNTDD